MRARFGGLLLGAVCAFAGFGCGGEPSVPRHLVLISLDTLRADHLGCYGHDRPTSPTLDALAAEGVLFERALATAPWTLPSHASLLTGLYPSHHGARLVDDALNGEVQTLAEVLTREGFEAGGFVNAIFLGSGYGFHRGFQEYGFTQEDHSRQGAAGEVSRKAITWLEKRGEKRAFLFLHYFDLHSDYRSERRYEEMFANTSSSSLEGTTGELREINRGERVIGAADAEHLERLYDAGIRQLDDELSRLFAWLDDHGWFEESLIIVTSDHGEEFLDHGGVLHSRTHHEELLRVPLILRGPGVPRGVRVTTPVSLVDVAPTAVALLGLDAKLGDGIDLSQLWRGTRGVGPRRLLFAQGGPDLASDHLASVQDERYKLIVDSRSGDRELYDLEADPGEHQDLVDGQPRVGRRLAESLERHIETRREGAPGPQLSEDVVRRLQGLGYVD